jgi:uncharacterized membrane protein YccC
MLARFWGLIRSEFHEYKSQLRYCLRLTLSGLLAFAVAQPFNFPLHGLWAVLTAIVVTQASIGASLQATTEYVIGTLGGAIYAGAIALLVPHQTMPMLIFALVLSVVPLAFIAALNPKFRVAPFTAVIVLFLSNEFREGPLESAIYRVVEVMLGGLSAIIIALLILPERAAQRALGAAASILENFAKVLPALMAGFTHALDIEALHRLQDDLGTAIVGFQGIAAEVERERLTSFIEDLDQGSLSRTLLRLRHDLVILGRAAGAPLPEQLFPRLNPLLQELSTITSNDLRQCAAALLAHQSPPGLDDFDAVFVSYEAEFAALRKDGLTRDLSAHDVERVFALGFALEQLHRDVGDLHRCVSEASKTLKKKWILKKRKETG